MSAPEFLCLKAPSQEGKSTDEIRWFYMIHKFSMNGVNVVMDIISGAVHVVDEVVYDIVDIFEELDEKALKKILTEPRNSLVKQYKKLFEIDGIKLEFTNEAISAFAKKAIDLKTGARGLRTIIENAMLPIMYKAPSNKNIQKIVMDIEKENSTKVVPTIIENTKNDEISA